MTPDPSDASVPSATDRERLLADLLDEAGLDDEVTRRRLFAALGGTTAAGLALSAGVPDVGAATKPGTIGDAVFPRNALEGIGKVDQSGTSFTTYGYLTHLSGLSDGQLFTRPRGKKFNDPASTTETTARFTFFSQTAMDALSVVDNIIRVNASGFLRLYVRPQGGALFANAGSFAGGTRVANYEGRFQNNLSITPPEDGQATADVNLFGELTQRSAKSFTLDGKTRQIGTKGTEVDLRAHGRGKLLDPNLPRSVLLIAANVSVHPKAKD